MNHSMFPLRKTNRQSIRPRDIPIRHLEELHQELLEMSADEREDILKVQWIPTARDVEYLLRPGLEQADRVEALYVFHKRDMAGDPPSLELIGNVLGVARQTIYEYANKLVDKGRAEYRCGRFRLIEGEYMHPMLKRYMGA